MRGPPLQRSTWPHSSLSPWNRAGRHSLYSSDGRDNPALYTVSGIVLALLLAAGVFVLLYSGLARPAAIGVSAPPATVVPRGS